MICIKVGNKQRVQPFLLIIFDLLAQFLFVCVIQTSTVVDKAKNIFAIFAGAFPDRAIIVQPLPYTVKSTTGIHSLAPLLVPITSPPLPTRDILSKPKF